ncbi:ATP-binding protein, partial [Bradyrhizobium sp. SSUT112]|uniref:AlbA family DNA-binding domain-containing protein n=1 Tax=Bradyrhizobium sp. SSUT112 TaxID=3040604 RepID=UPI002447CEEF
MTVANIDLGGLSEQDLLNQIAAGVPEGVLVDYKRSTYGRTDNDVKEFLKDISSFANTSGGHLIIGVDEKDGIPTQIVPVVGSVDQELQRLENLARDGLEPRIPGIQMRAVPVTGGSVFVIHVPKSWNPPHRVSARNTNRIYARNSAGAFELSVEELRVLFTSAASAADRMRAFRAERLAKIETGAAIETLAQDLGRVVFHLVPLASFGLGTGIDLERARALSEHLRPMGGVMGYSPGINFDGFANINHGSDGQCWAYTQIFRNGIIEAVKVRAAMKRGDSLLIPTLDFDRYVLEVMPKYLYALETLNIAPPIVLMLTLRAGPDCLNKNSASISGDSAGVRPPRGAEEDRSRLDPGCGRQG